jgi:hypothetical protein
MFHDVDCGLICPLTVPDDHYAEEKAQELEVLESIFPGELERKHPLARTLLALDIHLLAGIDDDTISLRVEPENQSADDLRTHSTSVLPLRLRA